MAADDAGERTEQATPRRREEAREEGRIARSTDLTAAVTLLAGLLLMKAVGPQMLTAMLALTRALGDAPDVTADGLRPWLVHVGYLAAVMLAPFLVLLLAIAIAGTLAQSGIVITWKKLAPQVDKLNPASGLRRLMSTESLTRLAMGLLKMTCVGLVAYYAIRGEIDRVLAMGGLEPGGVLGATLGIAFGLGLKLATVLLILALIDYFLERWKLERSLRMTRQEVRDELKRMEGDPLIKQRRRQIQMRLALQRIGLDVPKSDVVVTNPTEYAVALQYDEQSMSAPRVVAKGKDFLALRIRQVAHEHGIPIVQRPPLARALFAAVEIGQEVPPAFYRAIAEVLAYVYQLTGRAAVAR